MIVEPDWSFARRPFWIFSHVFAATVVLTFVALGLWQLARHNDRAEFNDVVSARSAPPAVGLDAALEGDGSGPDGSGPDGSGLDGSGPDGSGLDGSGLDGSASVGDEVDYRFVAVTGAFVDGDLVRVANRSQGGVAGEHVVASFSLDDGRTLLVNRGFVPIGSDEGLRPVPAGDVEIVGWLRESVSQGWLGATDSGEGTVAPRLDIDALAGRLPSGADPVPYWLLLADDELQLANGGSATSDSALASFPDPAPLPALDGGPHLSYMGQWFIFATLGVGFYLALLRRTSRGGSKATPQPIDDIPSVPQSS